MHCFYNYIGSRMKKKSKLGKSQIYLQGAYVTKQNLYIINIFNKFRVLIISYLYFKKMKNKQIQII